MRLFQAHPCNTISLSLLVLFAPSLNQALASSGDPLNLTSGPNAEVKAAIPTEAEKGLYKELLDIVAVLDSPKDQEKSRKGMEEFDNFIIAHPEYSDAYFMRAMYNYGIAGNKQYTKILEDLNNAIKFHPVTTPKSAYENTAGMYGRKAKVYKDSGDLKQAIKDLETAISIDPRKAFDISTTSPADGPVNGEWGKRDLDEIIKKYPKDFRGYLFRAVYYYSFGVMLKLEDYESTITDLKRTISLNPKCALAHYLLGAIMDRRLMFGPKSKEDYRKEARVIAAGLSIWNAHPEWCKMIDNAYTNAIKADPRMKEAYSSRASLYLNTQKYSLAIQDYTKILELDPDYGGAYHDRGLAYSSIGKYWNAIEDFTQAIKAKKKVISKHEAYVNRAEAYANNNQFNEAIADYGKAIELHTGDVVILMSLPQFRSIYPEYDDLDDDTLLSRLRDKYFPNMELEGFSKQLLREGHKWNDTGGFQIYEKRGDTFLRFGYFAKAVGDYQRAVRIWPDYPMDRWKYIFDRSKARSFLDITTVERLNRNSYSFWLKDEHPNAKQKEVSYTLQKLAIDCSSRKMATMSHNEYDASGKVKSSYDVPSGWSTVIPDSVGERLYKGWCSN